MGVGILLQIPIHYIYFRQQLFSFFCVQTYRRHPIHSAFFGIFPHLHFHHILGHKKKAADGFRFMRADVILPFNFLRRKISSFAICSSSNRSLNNVSPGIRNSLERFFRNSMLATIHCLFYIHLRTGKHFGRIEGFIKERNTVQKGLIPQLRVSVPCPE